MKTIGKSCLVLLILTGILSTYLVLKLIVDTGIPKETLLKTSILKSKDIDNPNLTKEPITITIGSSEPILINDALFITLEDNKGNVTRYSEKELFNANEEHLYHHKDTTVSNNSLQSLMLQTATASSNAYAGTLCCTGPYVNSNGEVIPRSCYRTTSNSC